MDAFWIPLEGFILAWREVPHSLCTVRYFHAARRGRRAGLIATTRTVISNGSLFDHCMLTRHQFPHVFCDRSQKTLTVFDLLSSTFSEIFLETDPEFIFTETYLENCFIA